MKRTIFSILLIVGFGVCPNAYSMKNADPAGLIKSSRKTEVKVSESHKQAIESFSGEWYRLFYNIYNVYMSNGIIDEQAIAHYDAWAARNNCILDDVPKEAVVQAQYHELSLMYAAFSRMLHSKFFYHMCNKYFRKLIAKLLEYDFDLTDLLSEQFVLFKNPFPVTMSPLHAAIILNDDVLVEMILKAACRLNQDIIDCKDSTGLTALQLVIKRNNALGSDKKDEAFHDAHSKIARLLLAHGANQEVRFTKGFMCCKKSISALEYTRNLGMRALLKNKKDS